MAFIHVVMFVFLLIFSCIHGYEHEQGNDVDVPLSLYQELKTELDDVREELDQLSAMLSEMDDRIIDIEETPVISSTATGIYVRWGRSICNGDADRIYSGMMGGAEISDTGSGSNYLCLPMEPIYANYTDVDQSGRGEIWGTEYAGEPDLIFDPTNREGPTFVDQDVPCAVCHVVNRSSVFMLPSRNICPNGWTLEYHGYLVSAARGAAGNKPYECVDYQPETMFGGAEAETSGSLYNVQSKCGTLPCPNYVEEWELTCAVCSK